MNDWSVTDEEDSLWELAGGDDVGLQAAWASVYGESYLDCGVIYQELIAMHTRRCRAMLGYED